MKKTLLIIFCFLISCSKDNDSKCLNDIIIFTPQLEERSLSSVKLSGSFSPEDCVQDALYGMAFSENPSPTINSNIVNINSLDYEIVINTLESKNYYFRSFSRIDEVVSYSSQLEVAPLYATPTFSTETITSSSTSATLSVNYSFSEGAIPEISEKGIVFGGNKLVSDNLSGNKIDVLVNDLTPETNYSFVFYITINNQDYTSKTISFTTTSAFPSVSNQSFADIYYDSLTYNLVFENLSDEFSKGFIYSKNETLSNFTEVEALNSNNLIDNLINNTTYFFRPFVENESGRVYFQTSSVTTMNAGYRFENLNTSNISGQGVRISVTYSNIDNDGTLDIQEKGFYVSKTEQELSNKKFLTQSSGYSYNSDLTDLDSSTKYFYQAFITNQYGTFKSSVYEFTTLYFEGDIAQGGTIFYVDQTGRHGLVVASLDFLSGDLKWSTEHGLIGTYFKSSVESYGRKESQMIIDYFLNNEGNSPAADYCNDIIIDGYDDWYLPNFTEMTRIKDRTDFPSISVWTSNEAANNGEVNAIYHWEKNRNGDADKKQEYKVIPIREF